MLCVGIDPGKHGAVAVLGDDGTLTFFDIGDSYNDNGASKSSLDPNLFFDTVVTWLWKQPDTTIVVGCEQPIFLGSRFTIYTTMSMFESFGVLRTVLSEGISKRMSTCVDRDKTVVFRGILPKEWIKAYPALYHPKKKRDKSESVAEAKRLFPRYAKMFERTITRGRSKGKKIILDGRAEAALIALYVKTSITSSADSTVQQKEV